MKLKRIQSSKEEVANFSSHACGLLAAIIGFPILIIATAKTGNTINIVASCVFASAMVLMYLSSTIYHATPPGKTKTTWRKVDHACIFLLIAGTYTPFTFSVLAGPWGWTLFGLIWALAGTGLILMFNQRLNNPWVSNGIYLLMGWLVLIAAVPLFKNISPSGAAWLIAGGLAYSIGVIFYALDGRYQYGHFVWHLFVLLGSGCHFFAVFYGCIPSGI